MAVKSGGYKQGSRIFNRKLFGVMNLDLGTPVV
jgi:hypothetical protein